MGGEQAKAHLRAAIRNDAEEIREAGFRGWELFATEVSLADVREVALGLHDARARTRDAAARALLHQRWKVLPSGLQAAAATDLVATAPLERDGDAGVPQRAACILLGLLGERAAGRADDLLRLLITSGSHAVRREAAAALARVAPTRATVEGLVAALERESDDSVVLALSRAIRTLADVASMEHGTRLAMAASRADARGATRVAASLRSTLQQIRHCRSG